MFKIFFHVVSICFIHMILRSKYFMLRLFYVIFQFMKNHKWHYFSPRLNTFICYQYVIFLLSVHSIVLVGCSNMTFGQDCNNTCGHCLNNDVCHHVNGTCLRGCNPGYHGDLCATRKKITLPNTNVHEGLIFSYWKTENMCVLVLFFLLNLSFYCFAHLQRFDTPKYLQIQN